MGDCLHFVNYMRMGVGPARKVKWVNDQILVKQAKSKYGDAEILAAVVAERQRAPGAVVQPQVNRKTPPPTLFILTDKALHEFGISFTDWQPAMAAEDDADVADAGGGEATHAIEDRP